MFLPYRWDNKLEKSNMKFIITKTKTQHNKQRNSAFFNGSVAREAKQDTVLERKFNDRTSESPEPTFSDAWIQ